MIVDISEKEPVPISDIVAEPSRLIGDLADLNRATEADRLSLIAEVVDLTAIVDGLAGDYKAGRVSVEDGMKKMLSVYPLLMDARVDLKNATKPGDGSS